MQCPLLYRYKVIDRLPDPPSAASCRGVWVHQVLEDLYGHPPADRTRALAEALIDPAWTTLLESREDYTAYFGTWGTDLPRLRAQVGHLLDVYWSMEDPTRLPSSTCEEHLQVDLDGLPLVGFVDRIDTAAGVGERIVDYKTGKRPKPQYRNKALWQLRFYALARRLSTGTLPTRVRLMYLGDPNGFIEHDPTEAEIDAFAEEVQALWSEIMKCFTSGEWPTRTGPLCNWCAFQDRCPAQQNRSN